MDNINEAIIMTTAKTEDLQNRSFYGDLSPLFKLPDNKFIDILAKECAKISNYDTRILYIPIYGVETATPAYRLIAYIKNHYDEFKKKFAGITFVFINPNNGKNFGLEVDKYEIDQYQVLNALIDQLVDTGITSKNLVGDNTKKTPEKKLIDDKKIKKERAEKNKQELVKAVSKAVETIPVDDSNDKEEIVEQIDSDEDIRKILDQIEEDENPSINKVRAARMTKVQQEFLNSTVGETTVKSLIYDSKATIPPAHLKVSSVNQKEWDQVKFTNFENSYDINRDIYAMLNSLSDQNKNYPIVIRNIEVEDTSTSMDYIFTYKVECEDSFGKRFTLKFDIPKFINNRFMMLRGNEKTMSGQLVLLPCLKTDQDTVQVVSNYNKIFIRRYGMLGKSYPFSDRISKALSKYKGTKIKITTGDNTMICTKYDLPVDYIDLASNYSLIETRDRKYFFDHDVYYKKYNVDPNNGIPYAIDKQTGKVIYYDAQTAEGVLSYVIGKELSVADTDFGDIYISTKAANRLNYSEASILANKIPLVVLLGYHLGLSKLLKRTHFNHGFGRKPRENESAIKFKDTVLVYENSYESSMLLNGLSECPTKEYTIAEMDKRSTWLEFLDLFGGRILSDGLENFKDLFMDPITVEVCEDCKLPTDYIDLLIYANNLLADNKYNRHTDISGNRYRTNEIVAAYFYIALGKAYEAYANSNRRGNQTTMSMKQTAVIDMILTSNISSDLSTLSPLLELSSASTATFKGPSGMNSDRAYSLDKRTFDDSMINKLALSTGFAANVGIDRQTTIDMDVDGVRGYIKDTDPDDMSITKTFSISEAVTPFGTTRDDPFRSAMTYIQSSKHSMRTKRSAPLLITNGADEAMPYMVSDTYAIKAEEDGKVIELTDDHMIIEYEREVADGGNNAVKEDVSKYRMINLQETVKKNSDGGFFITVKLDTELKNGKTFKKGDIIAYDRYSFGKASEDDNLAYNVGCLTKIAIMNNDEGFEDSTAVSNWLSESMATEVVTMINTPPLNRVTNIYHMAKVGQPIQEGDSLIIYQNAFEEEDANALLRYITDEDLVSDLGRIQIRSKYTGVVQDIKIYRTCEISEMSDTMSKIVKDYEKGIKTKKAMYKKYKIPGEKMLDPDYIVPQTGKMKNCPDGIVIEFYIKYNDKLGVGVA